VRRSVWQPIPLLRIFLGIGLCAALAPKIVPGRTPEGAAPSQDHLERLQNYRTRIQDSQARPEERRNWAEALVQETLQVQSAAAKGLVVELLNSNAAPEALRPMCEAIANRSGNMNDRLDPSFVAPLVELLGSPSAELRSACARALAEFPGPEVPARLAQLVRQPEVPVPKKLAAVDGLAPNAHRREVVEQLIGLLELGTPEITNRVCAALEPVAREPMGTHTGAWRAWWATKSQLSDTAWLADQVRMYRDRLRATAIDLEGQRERSKRQVAELSAKLRDFQREVFRSLPPDQRDARLIEWLGDAQDEVKLTSIAIIKGRIADEGKRPEGEVLAAVLRLMKEGTPPVRREVLSLVQNLGEPAVKAVLTHLEEEKDPLTREAALKALGKLGSPEAVPAMVREIASPDAPSGCVREAAVALGQIAEVAGFAERLPEAVTPLAQRYQAAPPEDVAMRAGLLTAMAGVADPSFAAAFLGAVDSDDAALVRPAIEGLAALGETSKLPRLRRHTSHAMPLVRLEAVEAVGKLGREDADLESILPRLNPAIEPNELVRDAAWRAFRSLIRGKPLRDKVRDAALLRDVSDREIDYLTALAGELAAANSGSADLEIVRERLGNLLVAQGKFSEAVPYLRELYATRVERRDPIRFETGLRLLDATLRSSGFANATALLQQLGESAERDDYVIARTIETVAQYMDSPETVTDVARGRAVLAELKKVPDHLLGSAWRQLLQRLAARIEAAERTPVPTSPP